MSLAFATESPLLRVFNSLPLDATARLVTSQAGCDDQYRNVSLSELCELFERQKERQNTIKGILKIDSAPKNRSARAIAEGDAEKRRQGVDEAFLAHLMANPEPLAEWHSLYAQLEVIYARIVELSGPSVRAA